MTEGSEPGTVHDLLRMLRNAVAHFNVESCADDIRYQIQHVEVWNTPPSFKRSEATTGSPTPMGSSPPIPPAMPGSRGSTPMEPALRGWTGSI